MPDARPWSRAQSFWRNVPLGSTASTRRATRYDTVLESQRNNGFDNTTCPILSPSLQHTAAWIAYPCLKRSTGIEKGEKQNSRKKSMVDRDVLRYLNTSALLCRRETWDRHCTDNRREPFIHLSTRRVSAEHQHEFFTKLTTISHYHASPPSKSWDGKANGIRSSEVSCRRGKGGGARGVIERLLPHAPIGTDFDDAYAISTVAPTMP
ncbi:hypothetical protein K439DRAFT_1663369 [Ramaria rubella]|nr:hypothetical protein K439DRAFT_1663369 [Ramaria rubella]